MPAAGLRMPHRLAETIAGEDRVVDLMPERAIGLIEQPRLDVHAGILQQLARAAHDVAQWPSPICWVGLLAKHDDSHADAATFHSSLSTMNLIPGPLIMLTLFISPAMSVTSTNQLRISDDISGANKKPLESKENELNALR